MTVILEGRVGREMQRAGGRKQVDGEGAAGTAAGIPLGCRLMGGEDAMPGPVVGQGDNQEWR
jgi:hypothetical protein